MTHIDGKVYEGYLSATELQILDDYELENPDLEDHKKAKSFILYTKPADQLHELRDIVTYKDSHDHPLETPEGKLKPIVLHAGNIEQWKSIDVVEKKVTLSDKQLGALSLGHMVSQSMTRDQMSDNQSDVDKLLQHADKELVE